MRVSTIILTTIWIALGIPLWFVMNFWGPGWWVPLPIPAQEDLSFYVAWFVTMSLVYLLPLYLLCLTAFYLARRYRRA